MLRRWSSATHFDGPGKGWFMQLRLIRSVLFSRPCILRVMTPKFWKAVRSGLSGTLGVVALFSGLAAVLLLLLGFMTAFAWIAQWDTVSRIRHYPVQQIQIIGFSQDCQKSCRGSVLEGETISFRFVYLFADLTFLAENRTNYTAEGQSFLSRYSEVSPTRPISAQAHINPKDAADAHLMANGPAFSDLWLTLARLALVIGLCLVSLRLSLLFIAPDLPPEEAAAWKRRHLL